MKVLYLSLSLLFMASLSHGQSSPGGSANSGSTASVFAYDCPAGQLRSIAKSAAIGCLQMSQMQGAYYAGGDGHGGTLPGRGVLCSANPNCGDAPTATSGSSSGGSSTGASTVTNH